MLLSVMLHTDLDGEPHDNHIDYPSVVAKMNYLSKSILSVVKFATKQVSSFMDNTKQPNAKAIKHATRNSGLL